MKIQNRIADNHKHPYGDSPQVAYRPDGSTYAYSDHSLVHRHHNGELPHDHNLRVISITPPVPDPRPPEQQGKPWWAAERDDRPILK